LPAEALHVNNGQAKDFHAVERFFDGLEFLGLDDGEDEFHEWFGVSD
jgi:hypothetical protein